ncbi:MAG: alpha/beta hydrolase [Bacteroidetes bacterium]|nr:alpha/beta hydrolase [Bacteroidota bacterium]
MNTIQKNHINFKNGQLFFRSCGTGPLLMLLHSSPQHSERLEGLISLLSEHFQVVAPDTPGYGYSEPLNPAAEQISDYCPFVEAIREHLKSTTFYLYGTATGSQIAIAYALAHPQRVEHLFLDNAAHFEEDMRKQILQHYFISLQPKKDGSELIRLREMVEKSFLFFPWFSTDEKHRFSDKLPPVEIIEKMMQDYILAGPDYARAYRAAFQHERAEHVQKLTMPAIVFRWLGSPLLPYIDQLIQHPLPEQVRVVTTPAEPKARYQEMQQTIVSTLNSTK